MRFVWSLRERSESKVGFGLKREKIVLGAREEAMARDGAEAEADVAEKVRFWGREKKRVWV